MTARLVYDGATLTVPPEMGESRSDQMQGTLLEQLSEIAGRCCYDSLGKGRSSINFHRHILDVRHLSVYRHATITVRFDVGYNEFRMLALACLNRKGVYVERDHNTLVVTANLQAIIEWDRYPGPFALGEHWLGNVLRHYAHRQAPQIIPDPECETGLSQSSTIKTAKLTDHQAHVSLYLAGSRSWSHEQIRHAYAVSQRSTRYCDEDDAEFVDHPLAIDFVDDDTSDGEVDVFVGYGSNAINAMWTAYSGIANLLYEYLRVRGVEPRTARKQARGAAARYLPHGLRTEMIFTASISGWKDMLRQRMSEAADGEMRTIYRDILRELKISTYGDRFAGYSEVSSPDGIGTVLVTEGKTDPCSSM